MDSLNLSPQQKEQLKIFKATLLKENQNINLFSRKNLDHQLDMLFEEGLISGHLLKPVLKDFKQKILDIGSGNGFPGIICGILYPQTQIILCERNRKKAEFLKQAIFKIQSQNLGVLCQSAEEIGERFEIILSQATASLGDFLSILDSVLDKKSGQAFLWKSLAWEQDWPKNSHFQAEVFQAYKGSQSKKIILKVSQK